MPDVGLERDDWMKRTGPFYSLLVAVRLQTALPVAASLHSTERDEKRALIWLPLVGAVLGVLLSFFAAIFLEMSLAPLISATLIVALSSGACGVLFESRTAALARSLAARLAPGEQTGLVVAVLTIVLIAVLRIACLASVEVGHWTAALIVSQLASRWAMTVIASRSALVLDGDEAAVPWLPLSVAAVLSVVATILLGGGAGFVALLLSLPVALAAGRWVPGEQRTVAASAGQIAELLVLLAFAAAFDAAPATLQPSAQP